MKINLKFYLKISLLIIFILKLTPAWSFNYTEPKGVLFKNFSPIKISIKAPLTEIIKSKLPSLGKKPKYPGVLELKSESNQTLQSFNIELSVRGFSSLYLCPFPKLRIYFNKDEIKNTLFKNHRTLDLGTHCAEKNDPNVSSHFLLSYFNHREAFLYRLAKIIGVLSFESRPTWVTYEDTTNPLAVFNKNTYQAFFLEMNHSFLDRTQSKELKAFNSNQKGIDPDDKSIYEFQSVSELTNLDRASSLKAVFFEYFILNHDWFFALDSNHRRTINDNNPLWNIKFFRKDNQESILVPHDFNFSGLMFVDNFYPRAILPTEYLSHFSDQEIKQVISDYKSKEAALIQEYETQKNDSLFYQNLIKQHNAFFQNLESKY